VDPVKVAPLALPVVRVEARPLVKDALLVDFGSGTVFPVNVALNADHEERADEGIGPMVSFFLSQSLFHEVSLNVAPPKSYVSMQFWQATSIATFPDSQ